MFQLKIRQLLEAPSGHPFYSELININPQTKQCVSLLLSEFLGLASGRYFAEMHFQIHLIATFSTLPIT